MKKKNVMPRDCLSMGPPILPTVVYWTFLKVVDAPQWAFISMWSLMGLATAVWMIEPLFRSRRQPKWSDEEDC